MKRYVTETITKTSDGDRLIVVEVLDSKPKDLKYIVFLDK